MPKSKSKQEMLNVNQRPKRSIKPTKCCGCCLNDCLSVPRTYRKRKSRSKPHNVQKIILKQCIVRIEKIDVNNEIYRKFLKVNNASAEMSTLKNIQPEVMKTSEIPDVAMASCSKNIVIFNEESKPKEQEQKLVEESEESSVDESDDEEIPRKRCKQEGNEREDLNDLQIVNREVITLSSEDEEENDFNHKQRDVTSIIYLRDINLETSKNIFPKYNCKKVEKMRKFFLNSNSTLKNFSKSEKYTVDQVLELLSLPTKWLNEATINSYFTLIEKKSKGSILCYLSYYITPPKFWHCPIIFKLPSKVDKSSLFSKRLLLIPINIGNVHWTLACVNFEEETIYFYDSLYYVRDKHVNSLLEHLNQLGQVVNKNINWKVQKLNNPKQTNNHDCGIFVCNTAWCHAKRREPNYKQNDIPLIRQRIVYELIRGKLVE